MRAKCTIHNKSLLRCLPCYYSAAAPLNPLILIDTFLHIFIALQPIFNWKYLNGKRCAVIGGGKVALRKVRTLLASGAQVTVTAPAADAALIKLAGEGRIALNLRGYQKGDADCFLAGTWQFQRTRPAQQRQVNLYRFRRRAACILTPFSTGYG